MSAQLNILAVDTAVVASFQHHLGLPRFVAATMVARGITTVEDAQMFLSPSLDRDWLDPYSIPGLAGVADKIEEVLQKKGHIVVFGDFDLDGISATATLTRALQVMGARVTPFIPLRFKEGYSLTEAALARVFALEPDLIVTVDCGIASQREAEIVREAGVDLAITDHHEPLDLVPCDIPVADPKLDPLCPSALLSGAGVALKLIQILGGRRGKPHLWREYIDLVTLGTVADLMPMRGENRALVAEGLRMLNTTPRHCIAALLATAGVADKEITTTTLSFSIIPRLNAAGRMGDAQLALDILLTDDFDEACKKATLLEKVNDKRRTIEAELSEQAKVQSAEIYSEGQRVLVIAGEGWHEGVKGIVANRLTKTYGVPVLLFTIEGKEARGSGRSVGQINLFKAVESLSDLLIRFGGHEAAVGVTLPTKNLPEFTARLQAFMEALPADSFCSRITIDACVDLGELTLEHVEAVNKLAPFGQENKVPSYLAQDVTLTHCRAVGADKSHFSCTFTDGKSALEGIMFRCPHIETFMNCDSVVNAAFEVQIDEWRGRKKVKALISALIPSQECAAFETCLDKKDRHFMEDLYARSMISNSSCAREQKTTDEEKICAHQSKRAYWKKRARENPEALQKEIVEALIGARNLHDSQREVLEYLMRNESVFTVMPTGRGKSLTFQVHAAYEALLRETVSILVYPLRALIADQAFHTTETLERFGVVTAVLTGAATPEERQTIFEGIAQGAYDLILTTPEFLAYHAIQFTQARPIGFLVIDEAHHMGSTQAAHRTAYAHMGKIVAQLGNPTVLALTATANKNVDEAITQAFGSVHRVFDTTHRDNLFIDDQRNVKERECYLANLIAGGEKTVIYVNSREQTVVLARMLRKRVPHRAPQIGFYNAGLTRQERTRIEELFRSDALMVLIATSAFGEGVNIPNIRHVALYHLPFNEIEFNQMSGRAGRDGNPATIHLLFGRGDADINKQLLSDITPDHDCLAQVYRALRCLQQQSSTDYFETDNEALAEAASKGNRVTITPASAACGIAVFNELALIKVRYRYEEGKEKQFIQVCATQSKVELTDSIRYCEGLEEQALFSYFKGWVMRTTQDTFQERISKAILPYEISC